MGANSGRFGKTQMFVCLFGLFVWTVAGLIWRHNADSQSRVRPATQKRPVALKKAPSVPNDFRSRIVGEIARNSPDELLDKLLENYNDVAWASTGPGHSLSTNLGTYGWACLSITKMARVRRIIQEFGAKPATVIPKLESMLSNAANGYAECYEKFDTEGRRRIINDESQVKPFPLRDEYFRREVNAQVATYLLSEFHSFDSLPLMNRVYEQPGHLPVPRLYLFYAMHVLLLEYPIASLNDASRAARDVYLASTNQDVPRPVTVSVPAWNATVDDGDIRASILKQDIGLGQMPQIRLREYPFALSEYDDFWGLKVTDGYKMNLAPKVHEWHKLMKRFFETQYTIKN